MRRSCSVERMQTRGSQKSNFLCGCHNSMTPPQCHQRKASVKVRMCKTCDNLKHFLSNITLFAYPGQLIFKLNHLFPIDVGQLLRLSALTLHCLTNRTANTHLLRSKNSKNNLIVYSSPSQDTRATVRRGGSVVGSVPCIWKVAGSNPTLAAT